MPGRQLFRSPIFSPEGDVFAAISISLPVSRLRISRLSVANPGADYLHSPGDQSRPQSLAISFNKSREPAVSRPSSVTV